VDTSLFNSEKKINPKNDIAVISMQELRDIRQKTEKGEKPDAIIINKDELKRIKDAIVIKSPEKKMEEK
jgi:sporulation protein YlmC with PRC-barrel domain